MHVSLQIFPSSNHSVYSFHLFELRCLSPLIEENLDVLLLGEHPCHSIHFYLKVNFYGEILPSEECLVHIVQSVIEYFFHQILSVALTFVSSNDGVSPAIESIHQHSVIVTVLCFK